jgi:hypothetical protein
VELQQVRPTLGPVGQAAGARKVRLRLVEIPQNVRQRAAANVGPKAVDPFEQEAQSIAQVRVLAMLSVGSGRGMEWDVAIQTPNLGKIIRRKRLSQDAVAKQCSERDVLLCVVQHLQRCQHIADLPSTEK